VNALEGALNEHRRIIGRLEDEVEGLRDSHTRTSNVRKTIKKPKIIVTNYADDRLDERRAKPSSSNLGRFGRTPRDPGRLASGHIGSASRSGVTPGTSVPAAGPSTSGVPKRRKRRVSRRELSSIGGGGWMYLDIGYHFLEMRSGRIYNRV
jgi:hypothetical protein